MIIKKIIFSEENFNHLNFNDFIDNLIRQINKELEKINKKLEELERRIKELESKI